MTPHIVFPEAVNVRAISLASTPAIGASNFDILGETTVALQPGAR
jgi:hypothetical protein